MFQLDVAWWELVARALVVYVFVLAMVRLSGKRTIGQFTPFDLLMVVLVSEGVSNALSGGEDSLFGGVIIVCSLFAINALTNRLSIASVRFRRLVEGEAVIVGCDGHILADRLKAQHVSEDDLYQALREADCDLKDMKYALLESDGRFSILRRSSLPEGKARVA
jgi:uncharacterized membrane protein YcaP (DUF421 family)